MPVERLRFPGALGAELAGVLELPDGEARGAALFAHCFTCGKDVKAAYFVAKALVAAGIAVMRFDFTGIGESGGDFSETDFTSNLQDLLAAAEAVGARGLPVRLLVGHSLGGTASIVAARHLPAVRAVATIAAPSDTRDLADRLRRMAPDLERSGEAEVVIGPRRLRIRRSLLEDLERHSVADAVASLDRALLLLHAPGDETVAVEHAAKLYRLARHPKSYVSLDRADHLLSDERDARWAGAVIAAWAGRYLD